MRGLTVVKEALRSTAENIAAASALLGLPNVIPGTVVGALGGWSRRAKNAETKGSGQVLLFALRNRRWVEWAVFSAAYLRTLGYDVAVAYSGRELAGIYGSGFRSWGLRRAFWREAQRLIPATFVDIDGLLDSTDRRGGEYLDFAERAAHTAAAYDLRVEEFDSGAEYLTAVERWRQPLAAWGVAAERLLAERQPNRVICPSGLIGQTQSVLEACRRTNVNGAFVEGWDLRPGHNIWTLNAPALHFDIQRWREAVGDWDEEKEREFRLYLLFRQGQAVPQSPWLNAFHQVQRSSHDAPLPEIVEVFLRRPGFTFLMGTNVVGDSATLGRATLFDNQRDWIERVIAWIRGRECKLIVRAHPDEAWKNSHQRMGAVAAAAAAQCENVLVIHGADSLNTTSLMKRADAGLVWVSNFGLEMAFLNKPVVVAAAAQYANTGACECPLSQAAYFEYLARADELKPAKPESIRQARLYQYIVFKCLSLKADSPDYLSPQYRVDVGEGTEREIFYRLIAGDLSIEEAARHVDRRGSAKG